MTDVNDFSEECNPLIVTTNGDSHVINQEIDELANGQEINDHEVNGSRVVLQGPSIGHIAWISSLTL